MAKTKEEIEQEELKREQRIKDRMKNRTATNRQSPYAVPVAATLNKRIEELEATISNLKEHSLITIDPNSIIITEWANRAESFLENDSFQKLVDDIEVNGQLSPIAVRPSPTQKGSYELIFGRRRLEACKKLGISVSIVVEQADDKRLVTLQEIENLHREDITFIDRAKSYRKMIDKRIFENQSKLSEAFCLDRSTVSMYLKISNTLPDYIFSSLFSKQEALQNGFRKAYDFAVAYEKASDENKNSLKGHATNSNSTLYFDASREREPLKSIDLAIYLLNNGNKAFLEHTKALKEDSAVPAKREVRIDGKRKAFATFTESKSGDLSLKIPAEFLTEEMKEELFRVASEMAKNTTLDFTN